MKSYVIAAMHGDEVFGLKVLGALQERNDSSIKIRVGNPEAVAKRIRFIESDLNRSFSIPQNTKESRTAHSIQMEIDIYNPDYIIDIHTSISAVKKVAIVAEHSSELTVIAQRLGMDSVVLMPSDVAEHSLIGTYPTNAISLEFGKHQRSDRLAADLANGICSLAQPSNEKGNNLPIYKVVDTIPKYHSALKGIVNLQYNSALKGYPFLAGPDTYPTIGGFLAVKLNS